MEMKHILSTEGDIAKVESILDRYRPNPKALIAILQDLQSEYNYLPKKMLVLVAERLGLPLSQVYRVATFYNALSLQPKGKRLIHVCTGTACHVRGAARVLDRIKMELGIDVGEMTEDGLLSLETVNCLGACALGPIVVIGSDYNGQMTSAKVKSTIKKYRKKSLSKKDEKD